MIVEPVTLEGSHVRLEPLTLAHHAALCEVGIEEELWRWIPAQVHSPEDMRAYIDLTLANQAKGSEVPFATVDKVSGRAIGSTRYMNIDCANNRLEIGATWIGRPWQRSPVNTEAKYLMLRHAFETLGCLRVELKTDSLNRKSRNAILRIGAKEEGIFRNHMITSTGRIRHSVYYSIVDSEWPGIKARLEQRMARTEEPAGPVQIDRLSEPQIDDLHRLFQTVWWTKGRTLEDVVRMLDHTDLVVALCDRVSGRLFAFARVLTDRVYKGLILDVVVDESHRGAGLGRRLMDAVVNHPDLAGVQHLELYCRPELIPFYKRWGFTEPDTVRFVRTTPQPA